MARQVTRIVASVVLCLARVCAASAADPVTASLTGTFAPKQPAGSGPFQLAVQIDATAPLEGAKVTLDVEATEFSVSPSATLPVPKGARKDALVFSMIPRTQRKEHLVPVRLTTSEGVPIAASVFQLSFVPEIDLYRYFVLAAVGVLLGYIVKLFMKVRDSVPVPPAGAMFGAPTNESVQQQAENHLGKWLARPRNYYAIDFLLTLTIAIIALCALARDGHPPDMGRTWTSAGVLGFGLGILTPNDLINRIK